MKRTLSMLALAILLTAAIAGDAHAFRFSPFRAKFAPSGPAANQLFLVENNTDEPASVQIRITSRAVDENGVETNQDADKDFAVYPAQMVLKPHSKRSVRVQWLGDAGLKEEKAYRIIAEQLPVNLDREAPAKSTVKFLVTYRGALFVTPKGLSPDVTLKSDRIVHEKGRQMLELVFSNKGTQHALLQNLTLGIKDSKGRSVALKGEKELHGVIGESILAGQDRRFLLPWPKALSGDPASVDFKFDKKAF